MSRAQTYNSQGVPPRGRYRSSFSSNHSTITNSTTNSTTNYHANDNHMRNYREFHEFSRKTWEHNYLFNHVNTEIEPSLKRRKFSGSAWESSGRNYNQPRAYENALSRTYENALPCSFENALPRAYENALSICSNGSSLPATTRNDANDYTSTTCKRDRSKFEDDEVIFMSRDEIERCSPSRKDGINALHETHLRYTYCGFLQNLGVRLELPQTTIGTAMVLCHRFFVRRSHACHDRFLIATAALFLAAKSEETPCPLNNVLRASSELYHKQDLSLLTYLLPVDWFEQYRERVIEAEQMILTTLNFELNVQHPYAPLTSILDKLGLSQSILVHLALSLISEG
ncbi:hypothetical protein LguiA_001570 [Lonicera macranthoides]